MSGGYEVEMAELQALARTFGREAQEISAANGAGPQATPDGGDATVTSALAGALQAAEFATRQLSAVVATHGTKLNDAYQQYRNTEESNAQLCQQLTSLMTGK